MYIYRCTAVCLFIDQCIYVCIYREVLNLVQPLEQLYIEEYIKDVNILFVISLLPMSIYCIYPHLTFQIKMRTRHPFVIVIYCHLLCNIKSFYLDPIDFHYDVPRHYL